MTSEEFLEQAPKFVNITREKWDALEEKDNNTFYKITNGTSIEDVYLGDRLLSYVPPKQAIAVQDTDGILWFDNTDTVPSVGSAYTVTLHGESATVTVDKVFTDFIDTQYSADEGTCPEWTDIEDMNTDITAVAFCDSFKDCKPKYTGMWFCGLLLCTDIDITNLNTSQTIAMDGMFSGYSMLYGELGLMDYCTIEGLDTLDTSNVTNMSDMFDSCSGLRSLDVSNFDTSNVTDMSYMFYYCEGLTSLDVSNFDTSNVTTMSGMFYNCPGLTSLDVSNFNTSNVTTMIYMFYYCEGLTSLDVSNFDTSNVTNMGYMFGYCTGLTTIYSDDDMFVTTKVTNGNGMFSSCSKLVGGNGTAYRSSNTSHTYAHIDTASNPGYFTAK